MTTDFGGSFQTGARALVLQPDGKLVAAGVADANFGTPDFALARYNADGSLDTTFGTGGKVTTDFGGLFGNDDARALVIQPDGKLVAAGVSDGNSALARHNPDGELDTSFNGTGKVTTGVGNGGASALVLQPDGKLVAASLAVVGLFTDFGLARYNPDGSLDGTFGVGGIVTTDFFRELR
ncbi:MAG: delta-60 repeat domain-containing protein [Candidatus Methylomirabilis sp.]|nr:delta-60 repeat domain-containing protein [Candidatus Methylomirabilis sp.]